MGAAARFLAPGEKLGKHDLIRQIAVGGMAELYLARTMGIEGFEKLVVVKRILPQYAGNASFVNMFLNEARLAATLHHPNIAQVYDIGQDRGEYFFSMEYVHGEDLGSVLRTATDSGVPISLDAALTLVAHLAAGLHHAHEKTAPDGRPLNVVHRDVSPSNVLVSYDGGVKLVDFGIARAQTTPTSVSGGLKGKISYMSPEQCRGTAALDRRSDVFSVGTILYELTCGQLPFQSETEYAVLNQIVNADAPRPSSIVEGYPKALEAIVMRALARDPDQRYSTALELQEQVENFAHESRLRVSPLTLARLMSALFPQRLEEWKNAVTQGAFFVEQHVVRTLIENCERASEQIQAASPPPEDERTDVSTPVVPDSAPTAIHQPGKTPVPPRPATVPPPPRASTPLPVRQPTPTPPTRESRPAFMHVSTEVGVPTGPTASPTASRMKTPIPNTKTPVPRDKTPIPKTPLPAAPNSVPIIVGFEPSQPGKLVSSSSGPVAALRDSGPVGALRDSGPTAALVDSAPHAAHVGDKTEYVRMPPKRRSKALIAVALVGLAGAAVAAVVVIGRGGSTVSAEAPRSQPAAEPAKIPPPAQEPVVEAKPEPAPEPKPEPTPEPTPEPKQAVVDPPKQEPAKEPSVDPKPEIKQPVVKQPPRPKVPKPQKPKPQPKPKPETKEPAWKGDSPFLPVRPDKQQ